jgi:hypothetical protein
MAEDPTRQINLYKNEKKIMFTCIYKEKKDDLFGSSMLLHLY